MNLRQAIFLLFLCVLLLCSCTRQQSFTVTGVEFDPTEPVGGKPVKLTCLVDAGAGEVPKNGGTNWHVTRGLLYIEEEIEDDHPAQNVLGKSSMSNAERTVFWIPPREQPSAKLTVQFRDSEPYEMDIQIKAPPKERN